MKRFFVVFVIVILLVLTGCQKAIDVSANVSENNNSIFFISEESIVNAGISKGSNLKDSAYRKDNLNIEYHLDNFKTAPSDPTSPLIRSADDAQTNTFIANNSISNVNYNDANDKRSKTEEDTSYPVIVADNHVPTVSTSAQNESSEPDLIPHTDTSPDTRFINTPAPAAASIPVPTPLPTPTPTPVPTAAPSPEPACDPFLIDENQTLIAYTGTETEVSIPDGVLNIGPEAFKDNTTICSVLFPDSVTDIGNSAFEGCSNLAKVNFSAYVKEIGDHAFKDTQLSGCISFHAPDVKIGISAFENTHIEKIILDPTVKTKLTVGSYAFSNCSALSHIEILNRGSSLILSANSFDQVQDLNIYVGNAANRSIYYPKQYSREFLGLTGTLFFLDPQYLPAS